VIPVELPSASSSAIATVAALLPAARGERLCGWCRRVGIPATARRDAVFCSQPCRQAAHRARIRRAELDATARPLRLAYADPPYPGLARRYYRDHPDFAGEVDLGELLSRLQRYDGWALSTSVRAVPMVLARCVAQGLEVRVAAWFRGARPHATARIVAAWEPVVVYAGGRRYWCGGSDGDRCVGGCRAAPADDASDRRDRSQAAGVLPMGLRAARRRPRRHPR
jgi:hypothetical protein